jgi:hypothetical protein
MLHRSQMSRRVNRKSKPRQYSSLQKSNGVISSRVQKVGGESDLCRKRTITKFIGVTLRGDPETSLRTEEMHSSA